MSINRISNVNILNTRERSKDGHKSPMVTSTPNYSLKREHSFIAMKQTSWAKMQPLSVHKYNKKKTLKTHGFQNLDPKFEAE